MHRHWLQRTFAAVLVVWFTALVADPVALHPCPMHDGVLLMASGTAGHDMAGMAMPREHAMSHAADHEHGPAQHPAGHQCTCLGTCTAASAAGLPSARLTLASALVVRPHDSGLPDYLYVPVATPHLRPPSHAPPPSPRAL